MARPLYFWPLISKEILPRESDENSAKLRFCPQAPSEANSAEVSRISHKDQSP